MSGFARIVVNPRSNLHHQSRGGSVDDGRFARAPITLAEFARRQQRLAADRAAAPGWRQRAALRMTWWIGGFIAVGGTVGAIGWHHFA